MPWPVHPPHPCLTGERAIPNHQWLHTSLSRNPTVAVIARDSRQLANVNLELMEVNEVGMQRRSTVNMYGTCFRVLPHTSYKWGVRMLELHHDPTLKNIPPMVMFKTDDWLAYALHLILSLLSIQKAGKTVWITVIGAPEDVRIPSLVLGKIAGIGVIVTSPEPLHLPRLTENLMESLRAEDEVLHGFTTAYEAMEVGYPVTESQEPNLPVDLDTDYQEGDDDNGNTKKKPKAKAKAKPAPQQAKQAAVNVVTGASTSAAAVPVPVPVASPVQSPGPPPPPGASTSKPPVPAGPPKNTGLDSVRKRLN